MTMVFDATPLAERMLTDIAAQMKAAGLQPGLAVLQAADNAGAAAYTRRIVAMAALGGVRCVLEDVPVGADAQAFQAQLARLAARDDVDGVLVQFPTPRGVDRRMITDHLPPERDVDCLHPVHLGCIMAGDPVYQPCTAMAAVSVAACLAGDLRGLHCVIVGASAVVGRPLSMRLLDRGATVSVTHLDTRDIASVCRTADVLFAAAGSANLVRRDWIRAGAVIIDIGVNRDPDTGALVGDVRLDEAVGHARAITAVPNGVGPLTTAFLIANTAHAACLRNGCRFTYPDIGAIHRALSGTVSL
ncbi:bifunctional 5,10-methylenetetrahydrofolate dehydrogenase/5,10-methenyltetrahydrofolate cyclohydrolase [Tanticharoenia sakaeratensis]|uniref:Bifunctional protein FolD n=1 Tax=Tanticharoenia sakaeratensis NBRC 103193 TaxID=1231623 RepID=A0A0D6MP79_9PROT|nr:bifunctional 5,10-methylenetetrahydrofolate dehydrogenase/5,10-methenyltetrahydrofolate cyclohydrolase [Tanticharoenia sakaeratensis]GAN55497.1 protein folD [Tanticharoenia sakaeratensis NBRC 103193]GBQ21909.1 5,10-methylene-tetrahydrofolate dehydrogenase [Tanticharoenia sakaeratensis NBRC 103193]